MGEIIEVCQECGHVIEPVELAAPWGDRYRITLCLRDECVINRITPVFRPEPVRVRPPYWMLPPVVNNPSALIRITGA